VNNPSDSVNRANEDLVVLLVEDDEAVRWTTARTLRRAGYEVLEAAGAEEALICMHENGPRVKLVLSDMIMPKQSGFELGQVVRERWPETQFVLISGYTPAAMDRHGIDTAGFGLLRKPVIDLPKAVDQLINDHERSDADASARRPRSHQPPD
jgi:DNA-binding NtrC family response regulator